ncbi:MAG TPA: hypothetical protein DD395_05500 [Lachnospiraceae bacterium]|nr:hypothetical protein [Lachnospiraceae bacterium]
MSRKNIVVSAIGIGIIAAVICGAIMGNEKTATEGNTETSVSGNDVSGNVVSKEKIEEYVEKDVIMPDVCGMVLDAATETLTNAGVTYYDIVWEEDVEHPYEVLSQDIAPGETVNTFLPVIIVVSSTELPQEEIEEKNTVTVNSYLGYTIDDAVVEVIENNLSIGGILKDESGENPYEFEMGMITRQSPEAGTEVDPQTEITLYYRGE